MLIIHPSFTSEYAKCNECDTIHVVIRVNHISTNCVKCKSEKITVIDTAIVPIIPDADMPRVELMRHNTL